MRTILVYYNFSQIFEMTLIIPIILDYSNSYQLFQLFTLLNSDSSKIFSIIIQLLRTILVYYNFSQIFEKTLIIPIILNYSNSYQLFQLLILLNSDPAIHLMQTRPVCLVHIWPSTNIDSPELCKHPKDCYVYRLLKPTFGTILWKASLVFPFSWVILWP